MLLLAILLGLGNYAQEIPIPVLAGILITVGIGIIDYKGFRHIKSVPRTDAIVMLIVLGMTVFVDLIQAVAVGLILSSILFMKQMSDQLSSEVQVLPLKENCRQWWKENIPESIADNIYVKHFPGPLFLDLPQLYKRWRKAFPISE